MAIKFRDTDKEYYLLVNKHELYLRAREMQFQSAVYLRDYLLEKEDIRQIKESGKAVCLIFYDETGDQLGQNLEMLSEAGIKHLHYWLPEYWDWFSQEEIRNLEDTVKHFPSVGNVEGYLVSKGYIRDVDYTNRCGNCHTRLSEEDKYCPVCGTKRGMGKFEPFYNPTLFAYGPFIKSLYHCRRCGHTWYSDILGEEELRYCPECGKETAVFDTWKEFSFEEYFGLEVDDSVEAEDYYDDDAIYVGDGDDPQER